MERFAGKVAVVTGASSGIGASIVQRLVADGLKVVGLARRVEKMEELSQKLQGQPGELFPVKADLSKEEDIQAALEWVKDNVGPIDVLVNNAGLTKQGDFLNVATEDIKTIFDTNVIALTIMSRDVANSMIENQIDGHIININSVAGHAVLNFPGINVYCGSKFAVTALTETLKKELARQGSKIRLTSISPGFVRTEFQAGLSDDVQKAIENFDSLSGEDIADAVAYVLGCPPHVNITELTIQPVGEIA